MIALAETEKELGLPITDEQIEELKANADNINYDAAREQKKYAMMLWRTFTHTVSNAPKPKE